MSLNPTEVSEVVLVTTVGDAYGEKAKIGTTPTYANEIAKSLGYTSEEIQSIPNAAHLGVGCGSSVAAANLKQGESALDLGSGGGIDVFLAATKVGPLGQVIGLDVSTEMIALARRNAKQQSLKPPQVSFVQTSLAEPLPVASNTIDCVLSNCVINLLPGASKERLLKEVYRVLKPGGRIVLDDTVAKQPLSDEIRSDLASYINCISGSIPLDEYKSLFNNAGFADINFVETNNDLEKPCGGSNTCHPPESAPTKPDFKVNALVASYRISAVKSKDSAESDKAPNVPLLRWWDAYPTVKSTPSLITPEDLLALVRGSSDSKPNFAIIDVRRDDHAGGHIRGSDNCPAQTFYNDLPKFLSKYHNTSCVIFYCGSSSGRGPRCAGWYQDCLDETNVTTSTAYVLQGGVKAWLAKYGDDVSLVDKD